MRNKSGLDGYMFTLGITNTNLLEELQREVARHNPASILKND